jgi:hypothetical protein
LTTPVTDSRRGLLNVVYALFTGYLLCYYSEWMFWAGRRLDTNPLEHIPTWLAYSFLAYLFLLTVRYFRVRSVWAMFLAGAVYGWLGEGVLVQTMYDSFPLNISVTGLSWHALISVLGGWYFMRKWLRSSTRNTLLGSIGLGLYYGFWSSGWWVESPVNDPLTQFLYNMTLGIPLVVAYAGLARIGDNSFSPTKFSMACVFTISLVYFVFITILTQPLALLIFPPVMGIVLFTLYQNRKREPSEVKPSPQQVPAYRFLMLLVMPLTMSAVYALNHIADFPIETLTPIYLVELLLGFLMLFISLYRVWKARNLSEALP